MGVAADIIGGLLSLAGGICFGVSMGTHYWYTLASTPEVSAGLFERCVGDLCSPLGFDDAPLRLLVPKVIMIVAAVFLGIGLIFHLCAICCDGSRGGCQIAGSTFYIIASIVILIAPASMIGLLELENTVTALTFGLVTISVNASITYGYSFALAWAAGVLLFVASIITCCSGCNAKSEQTVVAPQTVVWSTEVPMAVTQQNQTVVMQEAPQQQFKQPNVQW